MTSRERVLASIDHKPTDRVPVDFGGHRSSGISAIAYAKLKKALGITSGDVYVYDMVQQLAIVEPEVLDAFGIDVIELGRAFMQKPEDWKPWQLPDGTACKIPVFINVDKRNGNSYLMSNDRKDIAIQKEGSYYFEQISWPWIERNFDEQESYEFDKAFPYNMWTGVPCPGSHIPLTDEGLKELTAGAKVLRQSTNRAIVGLFGGNMFEIPQFLYGMENYLLYLHMYPEACLRLSEALCNYHLRKLEKWLPAVKDYVDIIMFGDDLGGQLSSLISPEMYAEYYKPYHTKMWKRVKEIAPHIKIQLHSCGDIEAILPHLIEAGLDIVNPVQISCPGMEPELLKARYGDKFTFWGGGCDTRSILPLSKPDEIKQHVKHQISIMNKGGGFVFQQVHNILSDVPAENIIAMFQAIKEYQT